MAINVVLDAIHVRESIPAWSKKRTYPLYYLSAILLCKIYVFCQCSALSGIERLVVVESNAGNTTRNLDQLQKGGIQLRSRRINIYLSTRAAINRHLLLSKLT